MSKKTIPIAAKQEILRRALAAYYGRTKDGVGVGTVTSQRVTTHKGKMYVVLNIEGGTPVVYRVRPSNGVLRKMKRPPKQVAA
jgi:hypothetical protein